MKKILSLMLVVVMLISVIPTTFALNLTCPNDPQTNGEYTHILGDCPAADEFWHLYCETCRQCFEDGCLGIANYTDGTQVIYEAKGEESYTITVPAQLAPGTGGTVTLQGTWADNRIVSVTADPTVTLKNSILGTDTKVLNVIFNGISKVGNNTISQSFSEAVSVSAITNALFGTWNGKFNYNVTIDTYHGNNIYFYQPYKGEIDGENIEFVFHDDGSYDIYTYHNNWSEGNVKPVSSCVYEENQVIINEETCLISDLGHTIYIQSQNLTLTLEKLPISYLQYEIPYKATYDGGYTSYVIFHENGSTTEYSLNKDELLGDLEEWDYRGTDVGTIKYYNETFTYLSDNKDTSGAIYPDGSKVIYWGSIYEIDCPHINTKLVGETEEYTGDLYCEDCELLIKKGRLSAIDYAVILDNSGNEENPYPMVFTRSKTDIAVGDTYDSKTYEPLPVLYVYSDFENKYTSSPSAIMGYNPWSDQGDLITSVVFEDIIRPITAAGYFNGLSACKTFDVAKLDTSTTESFRYMFASCSSVEELDLSAWNTEKITSTDTMFNGCSSLQEINFDGWNTDKLSYIGYMFTGCTSLTEFKFEFDTTAVTHMNYTFSGCSNIISFDFSNFTSTNLTALMGTFSGCESLTELDLSTFDTRNVSTMRGLFRGCSNLQTIYVSDNWSTSKLDFGSTSWAYKETFYGCTSLVGEKGTKFVQGITSNEYAKYAKVDGGTVSPGYLTHISNKK